MHIDGTNPQDWDTLVDTVDSHVKTTRSSDDVGVRFVRRDSEDYHAWQVSTGEEHMRRYWRNLGNADWHHSCIEWLCCKRSCEQRSKYTVMSTLKCHDEKPVGSALGCDDQLVSVGECRNGLVRRMHIALQPVTVAPRLRAFLPRRRLALYVRKPRARETTAGFQNFSTVWKLSITKSPLSSTSLGRRCGTRMTRRT